MLPESNLFNYENSSYASFILSTCLLLNLSCSNNSNGDNNGTKANLSEDFITKNDLGEAFSVKEIRERVPSGQEFIVEGFIGGRKKPFTQNSAVFILGDHSLETCDEYRYSCPTPWMYVVRIEKSGIINNFSPST